MELISPDKVEFEYFVRTAALLEEAVEGGAKREVMCARIARIGRRAYLCVFFLRVRRWLSLVPQIYL